MKKQIVLKKNGIGLDLVDIGRFKGFNDNPRHQFLQKVYSRDELTYCFSRKDPSASLAGIFAAKEASSKALGTTEFPFIKLEIRHDQDGAPQVWKDGKKLSVKISITHTNIVAAAIAMV